MEVRRCGAAAVAVALALACASPPGVAHAAELVRTYAEGEAVPDALVVDGVSYELEGWKAGGGLEAATRTFERTAYKTVSATDYSGDPKEHFDGWIEVAEEGFSGAIPLVGARAEVSQSHPEREDYEETVEFSYVTKEEVEALPAERKAMVQGRELTLSKLDVKSDRVPSDPGTEIYSGHAVYGIHRQYDVADEYRLSATYQGELSRDASEGSVVATYSSKAIGPSAQAVGANDAVEAHGSGGGVEVPTWFYAVLIVSFLFVLIAVAHLLVRGSARLLLWAKDRMGGRFGLKRAEAGQEASGDTEGEGEDENERD